MQTVSSTELKERIDATPDAILVDLYADWCGPCQRMTPVLEDLEGQFEGVEFVKVNVDAEHEFASKLQVRSIPTLVLYKDGKESDRWVGGQDKAEITEWLEGLT